MPFGLKNAPSEFQKIMNDIFNQFPKFTIVYIDDVLVFSQSLDQHFKHINIFISTIKKNGLAVSKTKINLFQTKIRFLGHNIHLGTINPINRAIEFADKFPNQIIDKTQLQRFLGCLNYVSDFLPQLSNIIKPLHDRLKKEPPPWTDIHTNVVRAIKNQVKNLPCLCQTNTSGCSTAGMAEKKKPFMSFVSRSRKKKNKQKVRSTTQPYNTHLKGAPFHMSL
jgi:hypothetical protein